MPVSPDVIFSFLTHAARLKLSLAQQQGLSLREFLVLGTIAMRGPVSFKQLHEVLSISKSALTGLVDYLHDRRLVDRRQDAQDRRRWFIELTGPGERLVQTIQEEDGRLVHNALESLDPSDQTAFMRAAEAVHHELAKANPLGSRPPGQGRRRRARRNLRTGGIEGRPQKTADKQP